MIGQRVPVQVVDEKAKAAAPAHPAQLRHQFFIGKMVAKEGRENEIRRLGFGQRTVVAMDKADRAVLWSLLRKGNAGLVIIEPAKVQLYACPLCPAAKRTQVITTTTSYLEHAQP